MINLFQLYLEDAIATNTIGGGQIATNPSLLGKTAKRKKPENVDEDTKEDKEFADELQKPVDGGHSKYVLDQMKDQSSMCM